MRQLSRIISNSRSLRWAGQLILFAFSFSTWSAELPPDFDQKPWPLLKEGIDRPLRYYPVGTDFVITNGTEFFNRPLYGGNSAFRVDGGDKPEFSFYVSGRGGNLRLGIKNGEHVNWLHDSAQIIARYRPGAMLYEITDPVLAGGAIHLAALATRQSEGLLVRVELLGSKSPIELIYAFGGVNGERGRREGDIGCESKPVTEFFQLRPEQCRSNLIFLARHSFAIQGSSRIGIVRGIASPDSQWSIGDASQWHDLQSLAGATGQSPELPIALARMTLAAGQTAWFGLQRTENGRGAEEILRLYRGVAEAAPASTNNGPALAQKPWETIDLPRLFAEEEELRRTIAERVTIQTPDAYLNAAAGALNMAADAIWDGRQNSFMHGGVAWRVRLLGWRGGYSGDALGWHERTREHFFGYTQQQNSNAIPDEIPAPEASANLSRNETALHSNGNLTRSHYDMNLVAVDAYFRHLLWTGDLDFARQMWPTLERHLAWERRLFRREVGTSQLPLYEAYCCIWASDDLAYNGGGATHSSAYNYYHNQMAARVARLIGKDPSLYEQEAAGILRGMKNELWLPERGWFAEWKDLLGLQLVHPNAAAWTFYHTMDSKVPVSLEAWQMSRFVDTQIARIPLQGPNVPAGNFTMPTTSWMPYTWSLNNVVLAESAHTALAYWQANRSANAFPLLKGALLDSMYVGLCPGNVGMASYFDAYRRESQRDFGDGVGSLSRALIEGLFGIEPDLLVGELKLCPGFPQAWNEASIRHPDFRFSFSRKGTVETYVSETRFPKPVGLRLQVPALRDQITSVMVNGKTSTWRMLDESVGSPRVEITALPASTHTVVISWRGQPPAVINEGRIAASNSELRINCGARVIQIADPQRALSRTSARNTTLQGIVTGAEGHRTVFVKVVQGNLRWWQPVTFEIRPAWEIVPAEIQDATSVRFRIRNNTPDNHKHKISIQTLDHTTQATLDVGAFKDSTEFMVPAGKMLPGSNPVQVRLGRGKVVKGEVVNWKIMAPAKAQFESVELTSAFNDRVTQIFKNEYLSPRSPYCSLALPKQGIGSWCHPTDTFEVDDSGLRSAAERRGGQFRLPQGVPFATPTNAEAKNILFTSQWTHYPDRASIPLSGKATRAYFLMAGSSNPMQSRFDNGEVVVTYTDRSTVRLALHNPTTWWPIDQDYFIDDFAFRRPEPVPPRVSLKAGVVRVTDANEFSGKGRVVQGGAATVLDLPLDPSKELKSLTVRAIANEVVVGLMSVTLVRPDRAP